MLWRVRTFIVLVLTTDRCGVATNFYKVKLNQATDVAIYLRSAVMSHLSPISEVINCSNGHLRKVIVKIFVENKINLISLGSKDGPAHFSACLFKI